MEVRKSNKHSNPCLQDLKAGHHMHAVRVTQVFILHLQYSSTQNKVASNGITTIDNLLSSCKTKKTGYILVRRDIEKIPNTTHAWIRTATVHKIGHQSENNFPL